MLPSQSVAPDGAQTESGVLAESLGLSRKPDDLRAITDKPRGAIKRGTVIKEPVLLPLTTDLPSDLLAAMDDPTSITNDQMPSLFHALLSQFSTQAQLVESLQRRVARSSSVLPDPRDEYEWEPEILSSLTTAPKERPHFEKGVFREQLATIPRPVDFKTRSDTELPVLSKLTFMNKHLFSSVFPNFEALTSSQYLIAAYLLDSIIKLQRMVAEDEQCISPGEMLSELVRLAQFNYVAAGGATQKVAVSKLELLKDVLPVSVTSKRPQHVAEIVDAKELEHMEQEKKQRKIISSSSPGAAQSHTHHFSNQSSKPPLSVQLSQRGSRQVFSKGAGRGRTGSRFYSRNNYHNNNHNGRSFSQTPPWNNFQFRRGRGAGSGQAPSPNPGTAQRQ
jgi:hypothetical protein